VLYGHTRLTRTAYAHMTKFLSMMLHDVSFLDLEFQDHRAIIAFMARHARMCCLMYNFSHITTEWPRWPAYPWVGCNYRIVLKFSSIMHQNGSCRYWKFEVDWTITALMAIHGVVHGLIFKIYQISTEFPHRPVYSRVCCNIWNRLKFCSMMQPKVTFSNL